MSEYADLILLSNCIFTATEEIPFSGYIAIKNDRILSIGKGLAPTELIGTNILIMGTKQLRLDSPMYIAFSQVIL